MRPMATMLELTPLDAAGDEVLNALEARTREPANQIDRATGARRYCLWGTDVDLGALEGLLDQIAGEWRQHILQTRG